MYLFDEMKRFWVSLILQTKHTGGIQPLQESADHVREGLAPERVGRETDAADRMEGLYIKVERDGQTIGRLKWIRAGFLTSVIDSRSHWLNRPILPNRLTPHVDIFAD